ncbi:MAG: septation protein IspZ [Proteobacteria bacterium]|nr:septation protein IspZ [Pseudomonadota bacterium]
MKNLFQAARVLLLDLASTLLFLAIYLLTDNLLLAVGLGMALGVAQIGRELLQRKPVAALQWISVVAVLASGTATFVTRDPLFVMLKPSIIYAVVGAVMLKRGWMNRYLPPRAASVLDVATTFGFVWAGLMFASAALNVALAFSLDAKSWAAAMSAWGIVSKVGLFLIQYATMTAIGRRRHAAAQGSETAGGPAAPLPTT